MAIKRIQLRGISRTPSDRMTDDGGCAESLNAYLDNQEIAPVIEPKDVTDLDIGEDKTRIPIYIHTSSYYKNVIVLDETSRKIYHKDQLLLSLSSESSFNDAMNIGNILYIAADDNSQYFLFKDGKYRALGAKIPFPTVKLQADGFTFSEDFEAYNSITYSQPNQDLMFHESVWNQYDSEGNNTYDVADYIAGQLSSVIKDSERDEYSINPLVARYAIRLYDGSVVTSVPFLIAPNCMGGLSSIEGNYTYEEIDQLITYGENSGTDEGETDIDISSGEGDPEQEPEPIQRYQEKIQISYSYFRYRLKAQLLDFDELIEDWKDIITDIEIYISESIKPQNQESLQVTYNMTSDYSAHAGFRMGGAWDEEAAITEKGVFYRVGSYSLSIPEDVTKLAEGVKISIPEPDALATSIRLDPMSDVMESDTMLPQTVSAFNNRMVGSNINVGMNRGPKFFASSVNGSNGEIFHFRFFASHNNGAETEVVSHDYNGNYSFSFSDSIPYGWLVHPNINCTKVQICTSNNYYIEVGMKPHPTLDCSYAYLGADRLIQFLSYKQNAFSEVVNKKEEPYYTEDGKLILSEMDNPMIFPIANRYSFSGRILGAAIASMAMSQGQFGQYPLYVFTNEGIWTMQTTDEGTFAASKPLSRDVCINAKSITPIDQAVVFVSSRGVMLLSGSQITELSPYMGGKHYTVEPVAKMLIETQKGFEDLSDSISSNISFMSFIKDATVAYDYPGKRLIFVHPEASYQYIYKIDSNTWHKTYYADFALERALNSYPDCYATALTPLIKTYMKVLEDKTALTVSEVRTIIRKYLPDVSLDLVSHFITMDDVLDVTSLSQEQIASLSKDLDKENITVTTYEQTYNIASIKNLSTPLDLSEEQDTERMIIATRPFDLDAPNIFKSLTDAKVRGEFAKGSVKFILMGSNDGVRFYTLSTLRGKSWKMFRIIILADLKPTDRISWIDIQYETRFTNKLR